MSNSPSIKSLFLDFGGVLLTNGWDRNLRAKAAEHFSIDLATMNDRHRVIFDAYEAGKMTLNEYLHLLLFFEPQSFSAEEFKQFMLAGSVEFPDMVQLIKDVKQANGLSTVAVNNEGRELNQYRIAKFGMREYIDVFASSSFVGARKPDKNIYLIGLDLAQVKPQEVVYLDDRDVFIQVAKQLGINTIHHTDIESTKKQLQDYGLKLN
ncbi:HAD family hydrolase [Mucilaginibacter ginkgonis]|uniref:HAD family phosphatase n=1 Tax=Mucilaginibacter ginkgonis TaxID=2682091 RepID=A0A6I4INI2_9SPHI|nr:HAD family phosphatase [Mucilaginibacter ginkgonis]QQL49585.1 HAD family phosphatase [Mucilaginibacter ginkgonis]